MNLILGMDLGVFLAWIGTLLAALLCIAYGIYYLFMNVKKSDKKQLTSSSKKQDQKQEEAP